MEPDGIWERLRAKGLRITPLKRQVVNLFLDGACGLSAGLGTWQFNTNATYTAGLKGIPTIGFGPSKESLAHIVDEYVELEDLRTAAAGYLSLINHILR